MIATTMSQGPVVVGGGQEQEDIYTFPGNLACTKDQDWVELVLQR